MAEGDLCEVADVQAWLVQTTPQGTTLIGNLITSVSRFICNYCGRGANGFIEQVYVDDYDGNGGTFMLLRQWPVSAVTSIAFMDGGSVSELTDQSLFKLEAPIPSGSNQRLTLLGYNRFPRGRSNVTVTYTAGYDVVPADVAQAAIELVGEAYRRKERIGQNSVSMKDQSVVSFSQADMNANIKTALQSYRRLIPC